MCSGLGLVGPEMPIRSQLQYHACEIGHRFDPPRLFKGEFRPKCLICHAYLREWIQDNQDGI